LILVLRRLVPRQVWCGSPLSRRTVLVRGRGPDRRVTFERSKVTKNPPLDLMCMDARMPRAHGSAGAASPTGSLRASLFTAAIELAALKQRSPLIGEKLQCSAAFNGGFDTARWRIAFQMSSRTNVKRSRNQYARTTRLPRFARKDVSRRDALASRFSSPWIQSSIAVFCRVELVAVRAQRVRQAAAKCEKHRWRDSATRRAKSRGRLFSSLFWRSKKGTRPRGATRFQNNRHDSDNKTFANHRIITTMPPSRGWRI